MHSSWDTHGQREGWTLVLKGGRGDECYFPQISFFLALLGNTTRLLAPFKKVQHLNLICGFHLISVQRWSTVCKLQLLSTSLPLPLYQLGRDLHRGDRLYLKRFCFPAVAFEMFLIRYMLFTDEIMDGLYHASVVYKKLHLFWMQTTKLVWFLIKIF